ncbi:hypothetical protein BDY21DRAFT_143024 [Lineolata rhizophorae]|uniref:Secreted protein n=1 Tax=Lineolata rhizophorae TaxID=578093 RepID=A0A6A6NNB2_9PEZI|nr:hypothetical protein BDY21DRAFT_143024 [Lineolata rhizophorae]
MSLYFLVFLFSSSLLMLAIFGPVGPDLGGLSRASSRCGVRVCQGRGGDPGFAPLFCGLRACAEWVVSAGVVRAVCGFLLAG